MDPRRQLVSNQKKHTLSVIPDSANLGAIFGLFLVEGGKQFLHQLFLSKRGKD